MHGKKQAGAWQERRHGGWQSAHHKVAKCRYHLQSIGPISTVELVSTCEKLYAKGHTVIAGQHPGVTAVLNEAVATIPPQKRHFSSGSGPHQTKRPPQQRRAQRERASQFSAAGHNAVSISLYIIQGSRASTSHKPCLRLRHGSATRDYRMLVPDAEKNNCTNE